MKISFSIQAWEEYLYFQTQDKKTLKKINELIKDIERNGALNGIGKPEKLTNNLTGLYSRRINDKDRLVCKIENDFIVILQCKGHYSDNQLSILLCNLIFRKKLELVKNKKLISELERKLKRILF